MEDIHPHPYNYESVVSITPDDHSPLVVVCPHAGIHTPDDFKDMIAVDLQQVLARGDRYTDWLSKNAPDHGAQFIYSTIAPSYLNVGRSMNSILPSDVRGGIHDLAYDPTDIYVNQGQGLVATKILYGGFPIYKKGQEPDHEEITYRIHNFYLPFHRSVKKAIDNSIEKFGLSLLFDVHSCPDTGAQAHADHGRKRPDLIIGDRYGESCDPRFVEALKSTAKKHGFSFAMNTPYAGGFNTKFYGKTGPFKNRGGQALQIEWNRATMGIDQRTFEILDQDNFDAVAQCHDDMIKALTAELI